MLDPPIRRRLTRTRQSLLTDQRCIFPAFAKSFMKLVDAKGWLPHESARKLGVSEATIYTYERGIGRPRTAEVPRLEAILGGKLDMRELRPSAKRNAAPAKPLVPPSDPVLTHLAAIALRFGYLSSFTPVA